MPRRRTLTGRSEREKNRVSRRNCRALKKANEDDRLKRSDGAFGSSDIDGLLSGEDLQSVVLMTNDTRQLNSSANGERVIMVNRFEQAQAPTLNTMQRFENTPDNLQSVGSRLEQSKHFN